MKKSKLKSEVKRLKDLLEYAYAEIAGLEIVADSASAAALRYYNQLAGTGGLHLQREWGMLDPDDSGVIGDTREEVTGGTCGGVLKSRWVSAWVPEK